jgi:hypothetical protein
MNTGSGLLLVTSGFLAATFGLSGGIKVRHPIAAAIAISKFGLLRRVRRAAGTTLGILELILALGLSLFPRLSIIQAIASIALITFTLLLARAVFGGQQFACACFGESSSTISMKTVARTAGLAGLAVMAFCISATDPPAIGAAAQVQGLTAGIIVLLALLTSITLYQTRPFSTRLDAHG